MSTPSRFRVRRPLVRPELIGTADDPYAPLRYGAFGWFIVGLLPATLAQQIQAVVVAWQIYALTHDPLALGLVGLAEALPFIGVALFAGHVADRIDRRSVALVSLVVMLGCAVALFLLSFRLGRGTAVWPVYLVVAIGGVARSFLTPSRNALAAELVPRALYPRAAAWRSAAWQLAAVIGPALGGLLYAFGSARLAYGVGASLFLVGVLCLAQVRRVIEPIPVDATSMWESLALGVRFVLHQPVLLGAMTLDLFSVLFGGAVALLPIFAAEILHVGPQGLGIMQAAPAAGAVAMSLVLTHRPPMRRAGRSLFIAVAGFGLSIIGFALSRSFLLSVALLVASGMLDMVSVVIRSTLLQVFTPSHLLGRVSSVNSIFIGSSNEIGAFESGVAAKLLGTIPAVLFGGTMTLLVVAVTAWRNRPLRELRGITDAGHSDPSGEESLAS
jgi:MFS family permease